METTAQKVNKEERIDLASYVYDLSKGIRRHFVSILVAVSLAASLFYGYAMRSYVPRYSSSATVMINLKSAVNYNDSFTTYYTQTATRQITQTFPYIASSGILKSRIVQEYGAAAADAVISATEMEDLNMISLRVTSDDPELSYNILQSVLDNYSDIAASVIGETEIIVVTPAQIPVRTKNVSEPLAKARNGALIVLAVAVLILLIQSHFKKTIRTEDDFRQYFNLKSLGGLPHLRPRRKKQNGDRSLRLDGTAASYSYREAARTLRSRLERDHTETGAKVYMVTSALAGEGKSTVSANLALSLAEKGYSVILMDMDLRNSSITEVLGLPQEEKGLADLFAGEASIRDILVVDEKSGVTVLPGGHAGKHAVQMLSSDRPARLLDMARNEADFIIVDTPPTGILSDAATIVNSVDAGIFVIRQDYAPVDRIVEGIQLLSDTGLRIMGCVLNNVDTGLIASYGRYSRYGYGYGYGYGHRYGYGRYSRYGYGSGSKYARAKDEEASTGERTDEKRRPFYGARDTKEDVDEKDVVTEEAVADETIGADYSDGIDDIPE